MTKQLHHITAALRARLLERGAPLQRPLDPCARDGYAALWNWSQSGEIIHRLTPAEAESARSGLPPTLRLAHAATRAPAIAYQLLERDQWLVVARVIARDPITATPDAHYAYAETMLCYITEVSGHWATGCVNLVTSPTPRDLVIAPGQYYRELYAQPLEREDIRTEVICLAMVLPHFYFSGHEK